MCGESVNGYTLNGVVVPEEVVVHFASFADPQTLLNCRLVCRVWRDLVDTQVWRHKLQREKHKYRSCLAIDASQDLPWIVYYSICNKDPYGRNLVKNPCGEEGLQDWKVHGDGANCFFVEDEVIPFGIDDKVPDEVGSTSSFVTCGECSKEQWIDLAEQGIPPHVMDNAQPAIHISDWYLVQIYCGARYVLKVLLCDANRKKLKEHCMKKMIVDDFEILWKKISVVFRKYPAGVRYIRFYHKGGGSSFCETHTAAKMTGSFVKLSFLQGDADSESETFDESIQDPHEDSSSYESSSGEDLCDDGDFVSVTHLV